MSSEMNNLYEFESFRIDLAEQTLFYEDERISLAPRVFETLRVLVENSGRLMTKDELMEEIWGETFVEERNLTQNIFTLRKEFKKKRKGIKFIETVPRRGYRFVAELHPVEIKQEEMLAMQHKKQMHITAEGNVTKQELTDTVKEITRDYFIEREEIAGIESEKIRVDQRSSVWKSNLLPASIVISVLAIGGILFASFGDLKGFQSSAVNKKFTMVNYETLTDSGNALDATISPDKQYIAYVNVDDGENSLVLKHIASDSETVVVSPKTFRLNSPQFSADGNYLYYGSREGKMETTVYKIPIFGGTPQQIMTNVNDRFSISPDGEWLAYFRHDPNLIGNHLVVCRKDGNDERIVATKKDNYYFFVWGGVPGWSPDGRKLSAVVFETHNKENKKPERPYLVEIDFQTGAEKRIKSPEWHTVRKAIWTNDGKGLIALAQEKSADYLKLFYLSYPEGIARIITNDTNNYDYFQKSKDDEFIIATDWKLPTNLFLISAQNPEEIRQITDSTMIKYGGSLDWTPNGKFLVYTKSEGNSASNIWKMNLETLKETQLTFEKDSLNGNPDLSITPDGQKVYFVSNRSGKRQIWRMNLDGSNQEQFLDGIGKASPAISADGKWLTYVTSALKPSVLWKMPLDKKGKPTKLLKEGASGAHSVSPDMTTVVAGIYDKNEKEEDPWRYIFFPFENDGEIRYTKYILAADSLEWSPDSRGVYLLNRKNANSNIYYYSLKDESLKKITNFNSQILTRISVSPDGRTIAAARGRRNTNILAIRNF